MTSERPSRRRPAVVKLGGSLASSARLGDWLGVLGAAGGRALVVPGGGPFADQVRALQERWGFDDATAHELAILAMELFGRMLAGLQPGLVPAGSRRAIGQALRRGQVPVWMPRAMTLGRADIAESWEVTSDSLAAWLAGVLGASHLVLVKSAEPPAGPVSVEALVRLGLVDPAFPGFLSRCGARATCLGPEGRDQLARILGGEPLSTERIILPAEAAAPSPSP